MAQTTIEQFAAELKMPAGALLEQLTAAGVTDKRAGDTLTEQDKTRLLDYLRKQHGAQAEAKKRITLTRKQTTEIKAADSTGRARTIQVEVRKKRVLVRREDEAPAAAPVPEAPVVEVPEAPPEPVVEAAPEVVELPPPVVEAPAPEPAPAARPARAPRSPQPSPARGAAPRGSRAAPARRGPSPRPPGARSVPPAGGPLPRACAVRPRRASARPVPAVPPRARPPPRHA